MKVGNLRSSFLSGCPKARKPDKALRNELMTHLGLCWLVAVEIVVDFFPEIPVTSMDSLEALC